MRNKIICGNCVDVMMGMSSQSVDLTITSPPYGDNREYKGYDFDFYSIANGLYRITKEHGVVVWVVGDTTINGSESGESFRQALYFKEIGFDLHDVMIYEKTNFSFPSTTRYHQIFEYIFILSKGKPKFNPIKDRKNKWSGTCWGKNKHRQKDGTFIETPKKEYAEYGMRTNIWRINCAKGFNSKDPEAHEHPAIFPEELARDNIISWSDKNDVVVDCMAGSGTTGIVAHELERDFILIDVSETYCNLIKKRFKKRFNMDIDVIKS